jgi:hypothetical protein
MRIAAQAEVVGGASYPATVERPAVACTRDGFRPAILSAIVRNEHHAQELLRPHGATIFPSSGECDSQSSARCLSTRIRNYGDVSKDRSLTVAALIGAPTVREGLLQNTRSYLRNGVLSAQRAVCLQRFERRLQLASPAAAQAPQRQQPGAQQDQRTRFRSTD